MRMRYRATAGLIVAGGLAALVAPLAPMARGDVAAPAVAGGDAVVVAVIDSAFTPYHHDFLASHMPQASTPPRSDDLPLDTPASEWLTGFSTAQMASFEPLELTLPTGPDEDPAALEAADAGRWASVQSSTSSRAPHVYWMPGTKIIAAATFGSAIQGPTTSHGTGTSSVSVGNLHGTCPECLAVLLTGDTEKAINWAMRQPWIDVITNSYGISTLSPVPGGLVRDRVYNGCALDLQQAAVERGQSIFFSAGNGVENAFTVPNSTLFSCQEGPDWIITVGAINSVDIAYVGTDSISTFTNEPGGSPGSGRPADVASIGDSYPSAYEATTVSGSGEFGFSGTSNATPVTAGIYARALYEARRAMGGPSRTQAAGAVAVGEAGCGTARPDCEVGDGTLTHLELRARLFGAARHTKGTSPAGLVTVPDTKDLRFLAQGRGAFVGRLLGDDTWTSERQRVTGPLLGTHGVSWQDPAAAIYARALSYCSQHLWGRWGGGAWTSGPAAPGNRVTWPTRTALAVDCDHLTAPPREPYVSLYGDPEA
jgi:hypothetical protein